MERPEYYGNPAGLTADIDVVRAIYDAFAARDLEAALEFVVHAEDFRVIPGSVVVMGHVTGVARAGETITRTAIWTWRVRDGRAVHVRVADMGAA